jgi:hypothetical protein
MWAAARGLTPSWPPAKSLPRVSPGILVWDLGDLPVGEWDTIRVRLHVATIPPEGSLVLAAIGSDTADIRPTDNVTLDRWTAKMSQLYLPQVMRAAPGH